MERAHTAYGRARWSMVPEADLPFPAAALNATRGIAGNRKWFAGGVKCLHAHVAHVLSGGPGADDNVVGQWALEELETRMKQKQGKKTEKERKGGKAKKEEQGKKADITTVE